MDPEDTADPEDLAAQRMVCNILMVRPVVPVAQAALEDLEAQVDPEDPADQVILVK